MFTALRAMLRDPEGKLILLWAVLQILIGTMVFKWLEGWSLINSLYFSVVTLATVGYGDLHPTTDAAKLFTIFYILLGLGVFASFISEVTKHRANAVAQRREHRNPLTGDGRRDRRPPSSPDLPTADETTPPEGGETR